MHGTLAGAVRGTKFQQAPLRKLRGKFRSAFLCVLAVVHPLCLSEISAAMSTEPNYRCSRCKKTKLANEYGTRKKGGSHGQKGTRLAICMACSTADPASRKRKRVESNPDDPSNWLATDSPISSSQFVETLAKHTSTSEIEDSWHVLLNEITLTDKGIADHVASLVWKATEYRFRYAAFSTIVLWLIQITIYSFRDSKPTDSGLSKRFTYECCQARQTSNDREKKTVVDEENQRIARRMERFDCHG